MEGHWAQSMEWDRTETSDETEGSSRPQHRNESSGSYHCKSALRDHESNMKLFLYKSSFLKLASRIGSVPYTDEVLLLLPDLWRCFFIGTRDLNREFDPSSARIHSTGSVALRRWADYTLSDIMSNDTLSGILEAEGPMWCLPEGASTKIYNDIYIPTMNKLRRILYLQYFLNLALVVLNYTPSPSRPDINVTLAGICTCLGDDIYSLRFNQYLSLTMTGAAICIETPKYCQIVQKDLFLNLCDKISERINVVLGCHLISGLTKVLHPNEPSHPDLDLMRYTMEIIGWGDSLLYKFRNSAYDLISCYEALCVSSILSHDDPLIWDNKEFQNNLLHDIEHNNPHLYPAAQALLAITDGMMPCQLAEVHGLWRIWGHPIIDLVGGMKKMEATCLKMSPIDNEETAVGSRTFKLVFSTNYRLKHNHYPLSTATNMTLYRLYKDHLSQEDRLKYKTALKDSNIKTYIEECLHNEVPINDKDSRYRHSDWDRIEFLQNFQIPQSVNLATMIKDKAISQTRSELINSVITRNSVFDPNNRRGVLKWLSEQTLKLKGFLIGIDKDGLPEDDCIIGLYPKERELKTKARFFSLMSYRMRMYITATEEILGKYLLPYFPMITMSDTLLSMIMRLYNMTTKIGKSGSTVTYSMNIDFSKWNQNMREKTNSSIFKQIDKIIGFKALISRTHAIFRASYLYLCSGEYVPVIIRNMLTAHSPFSRIGDESGKEGLRQKGWTIVTVCDILALAFSHGVRIELIGGGDNQVLTVTIVGKKTKSSASLEEQMVQIKGRMVRFRNALAKKMEKRGLPLKLEETWISHRLLMYNKIMYIDGVPLPGRLKVISRLFSNSNEGVTSLGSIMSTLGTGYQSLSCKDYNPILSWIISRWLTLINVAQYYTCNPMTGSARMDTAMNMAYSRIKEGGTNLFGPQDTDDEISRNKTKKLVQFTGRKLLSVEDMFLVCIYYHKILGGPGIGTPLSYIMKGFPDPLSECLSFNYFLLDSRIRNQTKAKITNLTGVKASGVMHWEHLLEDPVSVNHNAPSHGLAALRNQASTIMRQADIKNVAFRELISIGDTDYLRDLSATLCSPHNIEPRLLHDIVGSTIPGYVNTILSKVDQSTTLNKLAADVDVIGQIYSSEMYYMMFLAQKISYYEGHIIGTCPTRDAAAIRDGTWKKHIVGVTTPHPFAYLRMEIHNNTSLECDQNYISVLVKREDHLSSMTRGNFRPYFGSYTAEKFKSGVLASAYGDEDILKRALKIQKLLGWRYQEGSNMYKIIQGILSCVTDAAPSKFLPTKEEITGDVEHRYHDMATKHGGIPSNLVRDLTHVTCSTSTFIDHSKGASNETLHFQAAIIYTGVLASLQFASRKHVTHIVHFHERCNKCIQKIEHIDDSGEDLSNVQLASCPQNPLMYIQENDIPVHYHNMVAFVKDQDKRRREQGRVDNEESGEKGDIHSRSSWLLLSISSLSSKNMKRSAQVLTLDRMTLYEQMLTLRCLVYLVMMKKGTPFSNMTLCDISDTMEEYSQLIYLILGHQTMMEYTEEIGAYTSPGEDSDMIRIMMVLESRIDVELRLLEGARCKYQDPEYSRSRMILSMSRVGTMETCATCVAYWYKWAESRERTPCSNHAVVELDIVYHLYSLDRLSRNPGLGKSANDEQMGTSGRKRKSLFSSIRQYKLSHMGRSSRMRRSMFLYSHINFENSTHAYLCKAWNKRKITDVDRAATRSPTVGDRIIRSPDLRMEYLPDVIGVTFNLVQGFMMVIRTDGSEEINVGLDVPCDGSNAAITIKALKILKDIITRLEIKCIVHLFISAVVDLEQMNFRLLRDIEQAIGAYAAAEGGTGYFAVRNYDEGSLEIGKIGGLCSSVILRCATVDTTQLLDVCDRVFILTDSTSCSERLAELGRCIRSKTRTYAAYTLYAPIESLSFPYACLIGVENSRTPGYVSHDLFLDFMINSAPSTSTEVAAFLPDISHEGTHESVAYALYREYCGGTAGLISENAYNSIIRKLSSGLFMFALKSKQNTPMTWRVSKLISLIISVIILTSSNQQEMLRSYSQVVGTSFSRFTYKEIILYRSGEVIERGPLINYTSGSIGEDVVTTFMSLRRFLMCSWTTCRVPSKRIYL